MLFSASGPIHLDPRMAASASPASPGLFFAPLDKADAFPDALRMTSLPVTQARSKLYQLLDEAADSHEPIQITGKRSNAVLVSEDDWRSIQETLYLLSIPGMRDSIRKGMAEPLGKSSTKPGW
jgi:antitoxin YefM